jgi:hypothetical protein
MWIQCGKEEVSVLLNWPGCRCLGRSEKVKNNINVASNIMWFNELDLYTYLNW